MTCKTFDILEILSLLAIAGVGVLFYIQAKAVNKKVDSLVDIVNIVRK